MLDPKELKIEAIYRGTGTTKSPGGQHAGVPARDIRVTHVPSGIVAQPGSDSFRSEHIQKLVAEDMILAALTHPRYRG